MVQAGIYSEMNQLWMEMEMAGAAEAGNKKKSAGS